MPNILELMQLPQSQHGIRMLQADVRSHLGGTQDLPYVRTYLSISEVGREDLPSKVPPPLGYLAKTVSHPPCCL
jgi:hypothetical protein